MVKNRSIPNSTVIPQIPYPDVTTAAEWLRDTFGFTIRLRIGNHRIQMNVGDGAIVVMEPRGSGENKIERAYPLVRVEDVHGHCAHARQLGARIVREPEDHMYGERQYTVEDLAGHVWTFSQSIADSDPRDWGGDPGQL